MAVLKVPPALQSMIEYARTVMRAPPSSRERAEKNQDATPPTPAPARAESAERLTEWFQQEAPTIFAYRDTILTLVVSHQQVGPAAELNGQDGNRVLISAELESPSLTSGAANRAVLSLAAIRNLRELLSSRVGAKLIDWLDLLERSPDENERQDASEHESPARRRAAIRRQYSSLASQAQQHWDDPEGLDTAYQAFNAKLLEWRSVFGEEWRTLLGSDWNGPAYFEEVNKRAVILRRGVAPHAQPPAPKQQPADQQEYALLREEVVASWNDVPRLQKLASRLRGKLPHWNTIFPAGWHGEREVDRLYERIAELLTQGNPGDSLGKIAVRTPASGGRRSAGPPPGVPEWPREAKATQAEALAGNQFSYTHGVLSYMGYRVGKVSTLTQERRRRVLDYVFLGAIPQVNDRQYMRTWGQPNTAMRLRKLANSLATFTRNARRKQGKNFAQAIAEWEEDLAYLKQRYYDRRPRDWKWPKTVRFRFR
jgi:hypothetical protein